MSIAASGTIGKAVTFQKSGKLNIARKKPELPYSLTLPQQYQRWLYQDYIAYWHTLTPAQKQAYTTLAVGKHMSGFAYFMKVMLNTLPDIMGWWHLDERTGATATDFSKNANHGTIVGATHVPGFIDYALDFNGINNRVYLGTATCQPAPRGTLEALIQTDTNNAYIICLSTRFSLTVGDPHTLGVGGQPNKANVQSYDGTLWRQTWSTTTITDNKRHHLAGVVNETTLSIYVDGLLENSTPSGGGPVYTGADQYLGVSHVLVWWFKGLMDEARVYNRDLASPEVNLRASRRFPRSL